MSTLTDYYELGGRHRALGGAKTKYPPGVPYCEEICEMEPNKEIEIAEGFAMAAFTVDYLLRLFTVHAVPYRVLHPEDYAKHREIRHVGEPSGLRKTVGYFFHFIMLVDFMALMPYYFKTIAERAVPGVASSGILRSLRLIRMFRVAPFYMHMVVSTRGVVQQAEDPHFMRIIDLSLLFEALRLGDLAAGAPLFFTTIRASTPAITIALLAMLSIAILFGTATFMAERGEFRVTPEYPNGAYLVHASHTDQRLVEGAHANIFMSLWYVISDTTTMPTIDMLEPVTIVGEALEVVIDYVSLVVLTLPIAIIGRNFHDQYESFYRSWDEKDIVWSSEEEEDNKEADALDFYDVALAKLENGAVPDKQQQLNGTSGPVLDAVVVAKTAGEWSDVQK